LTWRALSISPYFLAEFDTKHSPKVSAKDAPKAVAKMRKQVRKTKDVLSANHEAPTSCEGMHEAGGVLVTNT
jgi:hypoxia up-regulated 1